MLIREKGKKGLHLFLGDVCRERDAQTGSPFRHCGRTDGQNVEAISLELAGQAGGFCAGSGKDGDDVAGAAGGKPLRLEACPQQGGEG